MVERKESGRDREREPPEKVMRRFFARALSPLVDEEMTHARTHPLCELDGLALRYLSIPDLWADASQHPYDLPGLSV